MKYNADSDIIILF